MATISASILPATEVLTPQVSPSEAQSADLVSFPLGIGRSGLNESVFEQGAQSAEE